MKNEIEEKRWNLIINFVKRLDIAFFKYDIFKIINVLFRLNSLLLGSAVDAIEDCNTDHLGEQEALDLVYHIGRVINYKHLYALSLFHNSLFSIFFSIYFSLYLSELISMFDIAS